MRVTPIALAALLVLPAMALAAPTQLTVTGAGLGYCVASTPQPHVCGDFRLVQIAAEGHYGSCGAPVNITTIDPDTLAPPTSARRGGCMYLSYEVLGSPGAQVRRPILTFELVGGDVITGTTNAVCTGTPAPFPMLFEGAVTTFAVRATGTLEIEPPCAGPV